MKRTNKILFCALSIALILCSVTLQCFAVNVTVESQGWTDLGYSTPISSVAPTNYETAKEKGYFSEEQTEVLIEIAEEMYKSNALGGVRPVLITLTIDDYFGWFVTFWCNKPNLQLNTYNTVRVEMGERTENHTISFTFPTEYTTKQFSKFELNQNGTPFNISTTTQSVVVQEGQEPSSVQTNYASWYYAYFDGYQWAYNSDDIFCACSEMNTTDTEYNVAVEEFQYALDQWKNANKGTTNVETAEYQLDIPAIITAIPNGAKQIINNAFGFELFGINVAGLLTAIIVIALVAFFVKWLMSR